MPALLGAHERLLDAGDSGNAAFFTPSQASSFQELATFLHSLLFTEAEMVGGAANALKGVQAMLSSAGTAPTKAITQLADFGAKVTETFHKNLSIYGNESLRTLNSMLFTEASKALDLGLAAVLPKAMVNLFVLANRHAFPLSDFLKGDLPPRDQVAVAQTLVNLT